MQSKKKNEVAEKKVLKINKEPQSNTNQSNPSDDEMLDNLSEPSMPSSQNTDADMPINNANNDINGDINDYNMDSTEDNTDDINGIYNQLSPEEQEATKSYAKSFLKNHSDNALSESIYYTYRKRGNKLISNENNNK